MPFNTLLTRCLLQSNSFTENGVQVSVRRESDEVVLFFRLDSGPESPFRRDLEHDGRLCDLAVFYKSGGPAVLCLVELKSKNYEDAATSSLRRSGLCSGSSEKIHAGAP